MRRQPHSLRTRRSRLLAGPPRCLDCDWHLLLRDDRDGFFPDMATGSFFVGRMFAAALLFGVASNHLFSTHRDFYLNHARGRPALALLMAIAILFLNVFEIAAPILVARLVFERLFGPTLYRATHPWALMGLLPDTEDEASIMTSRGPRGRPQG